VFHPLRNESNVRPARGSLPKALRTPTPHLEPPTHPDSKEKEKNGIPPPEVSGVITNKIVKFSSTLFIIYFSGRCFSLWMKLIMYSHMGDRLIRYTKRPFSNRAYSV